MIRVSENICLDESEIKYTYINSPGPGGQNVNKVASAVLLRFNITSSASLSEDVRLRLLNHLGKKVTSQGDLLIKAYRYRTQERNKEDALNRLLEILKIIAVPPKKRRKTKPTRGSVKRRLDKKTLHAKKKSGRKISLD